MFTIYIKNWKSNAWIFEGLPHIEIQLNQVRLKSAKWTIEIEHTKSF